MRKLNVVVRLSDKIPDQILYITPHVTRLAEFRGIPFDKRNTDFIGDQFDHIGFTNAGRAHHQDIVFNTSDHSVDCVRRFFLIFDSIKMGANLCGQDGFGGILFYDVLVEVGDKFFGL